MVRSSLYCGSFQRLLRYRRLLLAGRAGTETRGTGPAPPWLGLASFWCFGAPSCSYVSDAAVRDRRPTVCSNQVLTQKRAACPRAAHSGTPAAELDWVTRSAAQRAYMRT
jgi:hypothetical protein